MVSLVFSNKLFKGSNYHSSSPKLEFFWSKFFILIAVFFNKMAMQGFSRTFMKIEKNVFFCQMSRDFDGFGYDCC